MAEGLPGASRVNVKGLRERLGMSQVEFADANHVDTRTVRRWEHGHSRPSPMAMAHMRTLHSQRREPREGEAESLHVGAMSNEHGESTLPVRRRLPTL